MTSQQQDQSKTAAITLSQLAAIAGRDPSYFSLHKDELPAPVPVHDGAQGRPQHGYDLQQLAELILDRTGHLSDAICRLRLALSGHRQPVEKDHARMHSLKMSKFLDSHCLFEADGKTLVIPRDTSKLPDDLRAKVFAADQADLDALRARRSAARRHTTDPQE